MEIKNADELRENQHTEVPALEKEKEQHGILANTAAFGQERELNLWQSLRVFPKASILCFCAMLGALSDGYQYTLPGNVISLKGFITQFGYPNAAGTYALNPKDVSLWGGLYTIGYIAALMVGSFPADRFGRKPMLFLIQFIMIIACLVEMFATQPNHWIAAKVLNGLSVGFNQMTLCSYVSEIAPARARGALLAVYALWWGLGQFLCAVVLNIVNKQDPAYWRRAIYSEWAFSGMALIVWLILPESPRWLCERGRTEKARAALKSINGGAKGYDLDKEYLILETEVEDGHILAEQQKGLAFTAVFKGTNLRRTFISFFPFALQQWIGSAVLNAYASYFFQLAGLSNPFNGTVATQTVNLVSHILVLWLVERFGRRTLLLVGGSVSVLMLFAVGAVLKGVPGALQNPQVGTAIIAMTCIWTLTYGVSYGPLGYVFLGETSTILLRAKTTAFAAGGTGYLNLIVNFCTPLMLASPSFGVWATSIFYGSTGLVGLIITYFFIPEMKGRSNLEIDELFERRIDARYFATTETQTDIARKEAMTRGQA